MSKLVLYQYDECQFCQKVQRAVADLSLKDKIEYKNTRQSREHRQELVSLTGGTQVPCLSIDSKPMLESDDIIAWLYRTYGNGKAPPRSTWF